MGYLFNSGTGFLANAVTTASNVRGYLINKGGYLVDTIRIGISDFGSRVLDDGGTIEAYDDASASYRDVTKTLYDQASIVLFPSGYKDNLLYSHKPTDGSGDFSYTRGTDTGTVIGEDGYIKKERANLLTYSNTFDNSIWVDFGSPILTSGQVGYDGFLDAWLYSNDGGDYIYQSKTTGVGTYSIYAKAGNNNTGDFLYLFADGVGGRYFDLANGTLSTEVLTGLIDSKIEPVSGATGWYRCSITFGSSTRIRIFATDSSTGSSSVSTGTIYIQDAQLEQGLVATDYIETTTAPVYAGITDNIPRLDYSTGAACLLLEPSRTNLVGYSELINPTIATSIWKQLGANIFTSNYGIAPDGTKTSTRVQFGTSNSSSQLYAIFNTSAADYTGSIYLKGSGVLKFGFYDNSSVLTDSITLTSDWKRFNVTKTLAATSNARFWIYPEGAGATQDFEIWGAQCEQATYPTSYIPTYSSSQTRAADLASHTGTILSDDDFTLFIHTKAPAITSGSDKFFVGVGYLNLDGSGNLRFRYDATNYTSSEIDVEQEFKFLIRKDSTDMKIYINGQLRHTITVLPTGLKNIDLEWGLTRKFMTYTTALDTAVCESLTAL